MDESLRKELEQAVETEFPGLIAMLEQRMNFKRWGFQRTFSGVVTRFPLIEFH